MNQSYSTFVEEVKTRPVDNWCSVGLVFISEEDGGGKNALEAFNEATVVWAVLRKAEGIEQLGSGIETDKAALLLESQGRNPHWD